MSQYDTDSLYQFLTTTPEKGLRSILIDSQFTEIHFNILMKMTRAVNGEQFGAMFSSQDFAKVKFNPKESAIKPKFWQECVKCLNARGLLSAAQPKKAEKIAA